MVTQSAAGARVAIVDYRLNNIRSVLNALELPGGNAFVATKPSQLADADKIVLPGVGSFPDAIGQLRTGGWVPALETQVRANAKPFLGICLGMQLLATTGTEHEVVEGLGWIEGRVEILRRAPEVRIPHVGWNDAVIVRDDGLFAGLSDPCFYFVHSFAMVPTDPSVVTATCEYAGESFVAGVHRGNIHATQFHPEKSQKHGLSVLRHFLDL